MKELRLLKKAFEADLDYICLELRDLVETPACIILNGLSAGKTTFVQFFSKNLNKSEMNSKGPAVVEKMYLKLLRQHTLLLMSKDK